MGSQSEGEFSNRIYVVLKLSFGCVMQPTDLIILRGRLTLDATDEQLVDAVGQYAVEHLFGHPDPTDFKLEARKAHALSVLQSFAQLSPQERADITSESVNPIQPLPKTAFMN